MFCKLIVLLNFARVVSEDIDIFICWNDCYHARHGCLLLPFSFLSYLFFFDAWWSQYHTRLPRRKESRDIRVERCMGDGRGCRDWQNRPLSLTVRCDESVRMPMGPQARDLEYLILVSVCYCFRCLL